MLENLYTTKMSGNAKTLQKRFSKIRSNQSRKSRIIAAVMAFALAASALSATIALAAVGGDGLEHWDRNELYFRDGMDFSVNVAGRNVPAWVNEDIAGEDGNVEIVFTRYQSRDTKGIVSNDHLIKLSGAKGSVSLAAQGWSMAAPTTNTDMYCEEINPAVRQYKYYSDICFIEFNNLGYASMKNSPIMTLVNNSEKKNRRIELVFALDENYDLKTAYVSFLLADDNDNPTDELFDVLEADREFSYIGNFKESYINEDVYKRQEILSAKVSSAFAECGYDEKLGAVSISDRPELCQFQCNGAFAGAKLYKKAPVMIAKDVCGALLKDSAVAKAEAVAPGFINIVLDDAYLAELIRETAQDENLGVPQIGAGSKIIVDYGGPNVAKPLHIGHLRSAIIGESLKRLARACGGEALGDIHMGDWGLQIGLVIAELASRYPDRKCFKQDFDAEKDSVEPLDADTLNEIYPFASKRSKEDEAFAAAAHEATFELQNGRAGYIALWKEIMRVSVADLKANYDKLNVSFDLWYGESDADKFIPELMERLEEKGLLRESDGAMVVDVATDEDKAPMPPVIVRKSDNSSIYATTDLATLIQRERDFSPQRIWYVVDKRQGLHFEQVFRCAKKAGIVPERTELEFLGFGTMNGSDGKPYKTRDGGVMRLSELLETVINAAEEKLKASDFVSDSDREETARRVGMAAVKFGDLINHRSKDYIFDLDKFLSFEGKTGTYLLYTVTRINSILKKIGDETAETRGIYSETERELALALLLSGEAFSNAFAEKAPNYICESAYRIATVFSRFYHDNHILNEQDKNKKSSWIALIRLTKATLEKHLEVLGIEAVEAM